MQKIHLSIYINAPRERVWNNIINDKPYREWTAAFAPGSYFEGSWNKGDKIRFLAKNQDGELEGMTSEIADNKQNEFISIRHLGIVKNGVDDTESEEAKKWAHSYENYTLVNEGDKVKFVLDMDVEDSYKAMFEEMWPKALVKLKEISERSMTMQKITVKTTVRAPIGKVWTFWTEPKHIIQWNNASDDWHTTKAENDLRVGGKFFSRMEAKDGSSGFDFTGEYNNVDKNALIEYTIDDGRKVKVSFVSKENQTTITETFEAENTHSLEMQQAGWQAILDDFKKYVESNE